MTFDFFNPSHLAFGSKLTKAFNQLNRICNEAEDNLNDLYRIYDIYKQYINRNYPCPFPARGDAPCRTNELFDLINDENIIKNMYITDEGKFHCAVNVFKRNTNRLTIGEGETELKEGYAFLKSSVSNVSPNREIQFVPTYNEGEGNFLFSYRVDSENNINISEGAYNYFLPSNYDDIVGMTAGESVTSGHKAEDYEAIVCVGYARYGWAGQFTEPGNPLPSASCLSVNINGQNVVYITGWQCRQYVVVYLKPGDVLTGDFYRAFKVNYTKNEVPTPVPVSVSFEVLDSVGDFTTTDGSALAYLNEKGSFSFKATGTSSTVGFEFKCSDWSKVKTISFGAIGGTGWDAGYSSIGTQGIDSGGSTATWITQLNPPYTQDIDWLRNYYGDHDFKFFIHFSKYGGGTTDQLAVLLSNFSFTYK